MAPSDKSANETMTTMVADRKRPESRTVMVLELIKGEIQSKISPANKTYVVLGKDGQPEAFRADFAFKVNLRGYLTLQNLALGEKKKRTLSNIISFTSAGSDIDALALPVSMYVKNNWGPDGTKILNMVEDAMRCTEVRTVSASARILLDTDKWTPSALTHGSQVSIAVDKDHLLLRIKGARDAFPKIIEQICWLVGVAGATPMYRLAAFVKETKAGTRAPRYSETIHTGHPVIETGQGHCFNVSFNAARVVRQPNQSLVKKPGHCWKTMTELSIVASGFAIPSRSRQESGLEAPLFVLRQLFKRGCSKSQPLALDNPMVIFPPSQVDKKDKSGKIIQVYELRLILAADCDRRKRGNTIYWHFDPAKICATVASIQQLEHGISVEPSALDSNSRHIVGWSSDAGHLTTAPGKVPEGKFSNLTARPHYRLVISSVSGAGRVDPAGSLGFALTTEEVNNITRTGEMLKTRSDYLEAVRNRSFVLFDTELKRGWLVGGDIVALHLLRVRLQKESDSKDFDFSSFNLLEKDVQSAYTVLAKFNPPEESIKKLMEKIEEPESSNAKTPAEIKEEAIKKVIGTKLDGLYAVVLLLSAESLKINKFGHLSGRIRSWYDEKWGTTLRGWDFNKIAGGKDAEVYTLKLDNNPGWLRIPEELNAPILFANGLGEILEPRPDSCCPYFPTLPKGQNFLAADVEVVGRLIKEYGGSTDKVVARLSPRQGWKRRLNPFARPNCQGDHLDALEPSCFPVQGTEYAPWFDDVDKRHKTDAKLMKSMYSKVEIQEMIKDKEKGLVVFGRQPGSEELKEIYRRGLQNRQSGSQNTEKAASAVAKAPSRPSSRGSTSGPKGLVAGGRGPIPTTQPRAPSNGEGATGSSSSATVSQPKTVMQKTRPGSQQRTPSVSSERSAASTSEHIGAVKQRTGPPPSAVAQRTPSISSVRSAASSTQPMASSTAADAENPRMSRKKPSGASLRDTDSKNRPKAAIAGSDQSHKPSPQATTPTPTRKASNSSVTSARTTSSTTSKGAGRSDPPASAAQPSPAGLKKTATNISDKSAGSRSSKGTRSSAGGCTAAGGNQRQQRAGQQPGANTMADSTLAAPQANSSNHQASSSGATQAPYSTSSGPAPAANIGSDGSYY